MIKKFWGRHFGILDDFSVDLEPLTLLVGPNASGKSTFLRGLRLTAMLVRMPLYGARGPLILGYRASIEDLVPREDSRRPVTLGVQSESQYGHGLYEISLDYVGEKVRVVDERAQWTGASGRSFQFDRTTPPLRFDYRGAEVTSNLPRAASLPFLCLPYRSDPQWVDKLDLLYELTSSFSPFHVFRFSPAEIGRPVEAGSTVNYEGQGLAAELDRLLGEERDKFDSLVRQLREVFPHIKGVKVLTRPGQPSHREGSSGRAALKSIVLERADGTEIPAELESDGVLLTMAHLWLASQSRTRVAFGIEEPETASYPSLLESRLRLLRSVSEGSGGVPPVQVIATTHSASLLTAAQDPALVRIFESRDDGFSRIYAPPEDRMFEVLERRLAWTTGTER